MPLENTLRKASEERLAGRRWRARDILRSSLSQYGYEPRLYQALGDVLQEMGDLPLAGQYFLLSCEAPSTQQEEAIQVFLEQNRHRDLREVVALFPQAARLTSVKDYPVWVQPRLRSWDVPEVLWKMKETTSQQVDSTWNTGCFMALVLVGMLAVLGGGVLIHWLWRFLNF